MPNKRLFVAIGFSEGFRKEVETWMRKLRKTADQKEMSVKWTPPDHFHVTLVFLGNTPEGEIPRLTDALARVASRHRPFELKIRSVGAFPAVEHARALWLGVQRSQALLDLQSDLENELGKSSEETHEFTPHLTFGRLRSPKSCRDLLSPFQHADFGRQQVSEIVLYESLQAGNFPVYKPVARAPL
jgi:2'-5' RNA ligase